MADDREEDKICRAIALLRCLGYTVVAPRSKPDDLTPAKALRFLIESERRDRARAERRARVRAQIEAAAVRMFSPFAQRRKPNAH